MRILFIADTVSNTGPANVNKEIYEHLSRCQEVVNVSQTSLLKIVDLVNLLIKCDFVVTDGFDRLFVILQRIAKRLKKPFVLIMHGYLTYENKINNLGLSSSYCLAYDRYLENSDAIITLSKLQKDFIVQQKANFDKKVFACPMGLNVQNREHIKDCEFVRVAVSGGTRPIKRNDFVARSVNLLNVNNKKIEFYVYGRCYSGSIELIAKDLSKDVMCYRGQVSQECFLEELRSVDVFVMASLHEPFGLSAIDALQSGCSVLLSEQCGVIEALDTAESDLIYLSDSEETVAKKIEYLIEHPNHRRLKNSINYKRQNWDVFTQELIRVLRNL